MITNRQEMGCWITIFEHQFFDVPISLHVCFHVGRVEYNSVFRCNPFIPGFREGKSTAHPFLTSNTIFIRQTSFVPVLVTFPTPPFSFPVSESCDPCGGLLLFSAQLERAGSDLGWSERAAREAWFQGGMG